VIFQGTLISYVDLTPFIPLSLKGEGGEKKEGLTPLLGTPKIRRV
jgi:hypothetical protein